MHRPSLSSYLFVALLVGAAWTTLNADMLWSLSVDIAHHYALVFRLTENWQLIGNDPTLGEMNVYPRSSHLAAAIVGMVVGSPFLGMQLMALFSLVLLWAASLAILYSQPNRSGPLAALVLALLVVVNHGAFRIHGAEISGNYFYSQLVAQALVFLALAAAIRIETRQHRVWAYLFLLGMLYVVTGVHLMPALELLGVLAGVLLLELFQPGIAPGARARTALAAAVAVVAGIAIVVLNPSFAAMRGISENNGGVSLGPLGPVWSIGLVCLIVLATTLPLLRLWHRDPAVNVMHKYVAMYGAAVAGLCLLQMALRYVGLGSDYAVKKYAFGLVSYVFLRIAMWGGSALQDRLARRPRATQVAAGPAFWLAVFGLALGVTVAQSARMTPVLDTSDVVAIERQLITLRDSALSPAAPGKTHLVADAQGMPPVLNYMFSLALARTPREVAGHDFLAGTALGPFAQYDTIVSSRGTSRFGRAAHCSKAATGPLLTLDAACLEQAMQEASVCRGNFDFTQKGGIDPAMLKGFSGPEEAFRWTDAPEAVFTCKSGPQLRVARIELAPFLAPQHPRQRLRIAVNGAQAVEVELSTPESRVIEVPLPQVAAGQALAIGFALPDAKSPQALGLGADTRILGVAVRRLSFE